MSRDHRIGVDTPPLLTSTIRPEQSRIIGMAGHRFERELNRIPEREYTLRYVVVIKISADLKTIRNTIGYVGRNTETDVKRAIKYDLDTERGWGGIGYEIDNLDYTLTPQGQIPTLQIIQNTMREHKPISVFNLYTNIINLDSQPGMCVPDALTKKFPKIAKLKKSPISLMKEANTEQVMEFCKKYGIRAIAYDIHKNVIAENIPEKDDKKYASLIYLYYANHMYLIDNKYLAEKPTPEKTVLQDETTLQEHFKSLLNQHILPGNIHASGGTILSFSHDDTIYFTNDDYGKVQQIGKKFMFSDKMPYHIKLPYVLSTLEKLYSSTNINSFMPIHHIKPAFIYNVEPKSDDHQTIDKNKAYSYILKNLPYLLSTDMRTYDCIKTDQYDDEYALYVAEPFSPNILMPKRDIYSGQHIKYCKGKIQFTIHEKLTCKKHPNHFKILIEDLFLHLDHSIAKQVVVQAIGTFQSEPKRKTVWNVVSKDDRNPHNFSFECENMFLEESKSNKVSNLYNRKPIAIQVKDRMSQMLFDKMLELKLSDSDIIQINTDSITFYNKPLHLILNKDDFDGWKQGEYKQKQGSIYDTSVPFDTFFQRIQNDNTLITGPAGNGKSYHIQHMDLTDSIILSSKHSAIRQHKEKGLNAHVIQKFCGVSEITKTTIPTESHIIVEECGILTRQHWDFLFKCVLLNKKLTILGDFNQLLPVDESKPYNQPAFLNMIFNNQHTKNENWRNDFTLEYYDSLLSGSKEYLEQELKKYSTKTPESADVIIAYRNDIVDKYNDYMLAYRNQTITDDDVPVMCITNDLRKHDMYNNFLFKSQEIPVDLLEKGYFRVAYARTLYNLQGDETKSFYVAPEDMKWFLNPRMAYTLISRLSKRSE